MDGRNLAVNVLSHLRIHGAQMLLPKGIDHKTASLLTKKGNKYLSVILEIVKKEDPEIVCLNEVLRGLHERELTEFLRSLGFKTLIWGEANHYKDPLQISTLLAFKEKAKKEDLELPMPRRIGAGGGACLGVIEKRRVAVLGFHAPSIGNDIAGKQFSFISKVLNKYKDYNVMVLGDMNKEEKELRNVAPEWFSRFNLKCAGKEPTCPYYYVPFYPPKKIDHILYNPSKLNFLGERLLESCSDHRVLIGEFLFS